MDVERKSVKGGELMRYASEDVVWYHAQFTHVAFEGVVRGPADHQPDVTEPTYVVTLLSGPYAGQTNTVYESDLRSSVPRSDAHAPSFDTSTDASTRESGWGRRTRTVHPKCTTEDECGA
jgi:hypothetical protein